MSADNASMRAWQVSGQGEPRDVLHLVEVPRPLPGPGMVSLEVRAAGVGLPDVLMCRGSYPLTPELPFTPGQEVCGVVAATGEGVDASLVGERVMAVTGFYLGHGGFATHTVAGAATCYRVPDDMADTEAAGFTIPFHTAWIGLHRRAGLTEGETVLVLGAAGGSGAAAVLVARALGARVIAVAGGDEKAAFCRRMGADEVIDHTTDPVLDRSRELTGDRGVDVVFDPVGGDPGTAAVGALANEGRHLLVGFAAGSWANPPMHDVVVRNVSMAGVYVGSYDRAEMETMHEAMLETLRAQNTSEIVTTVVPFDRVPEAVDAVGDRSAVGKTVVAVL